MKTIVSNATPVISLASADALFLFEKLFGKVIIPEAVYNEIYSARYPGYTELNSNIFEIRKISDRVSLGFLLNDLDLGEAESILLAKEINADKLIIDERLGYKIAQTQGLFVIGTLTVLLMAKQDGIITSVKPILDKMINNGRWYSKKVYEHFLKTIGEL